jgi:hypothetical protein
MELLIVALALFIGMIVCWFVLPDDTAPATMAYSVDVPRHATSEQAAESPRGRARFRASRNVSKTNAIQ